MNDAASLFLVLFGLPSLILAIAFAAVALKAPRGGAALCGMLLVSIVPLLFWANRGGYMATAGWMIALSIVIAASGFIVAIVNLLRRGTGSAAKDSGP
jgi:hypothetical protein